ncbi:MAG: ABC transporter permease [Fibrobacterota bacterium]
MKERLLNLFLINSRLCLLEVSSNRARSLISAFGIFLGVASVLTLLSFMRAMGTQVSKSMLSMGGLDIMTVKKLSADTRDEAVAFRRSPGLTLEQIRALQAQIPQISTVLPEISLGRQEVKGNGRGQHSAPVAVGPGHLSVYNYIIGKGRAFQPEDFDASAHVCIIGSRVAERLFDKTNPVGTSISFKGIPFTIIGLIQTDDPWDRRARQVLIPYTTYFRDIGGASAQLTSIGLKVRDITELKKAQEAVITALTGMHRGVQDFDVTLNEDKIREMENTNFALNLLLYILAALSLLTGGVSIMNIMFATVGDRVREIGLRKALGARKSDLFVQVMLETLLLCFTGAAPGLVVGSIVSWLPEDLMPITPSLSAGDYGLVLGFTLVTGIAAGLFPAFKAAAMRPIEALQYA